MDQKQEGKQPNSGNRVMLLSASILFGVVVFSWIKYLDNEIKLTWRNTFSQNTGTKILLNVLLHHNEWGSDINFTLIRNVCI